MTDPDLQHLADDSAAHEAKVEAKRAAFARGEAPRFLRVDGHLVDLAPPARATFPAPPSTFPAGTMTHAEAEEVAAQVKAITAAAAPVACCAACGRPLIGVGP